MSGATDDLPPTDTAGVLDRVWRAADLIFDFRFRRYLTPHIVKAFWLMMLATVAVFLFVSTFVAPFTGGGLGAHGGPDQFRARLADKPPVPAPESNTLGRSFGEIFSWALWSFIQFVAAVLVLMMTRVVGEFAVIVFNISHDLKRLQPGIAPQTTEATAGFARRPGS